MTDPFAALEEHVKRNNSTWQRLRELFYRMQGSSLDIHRNLFTTDMLEREFTHLRFLNYLLCVKEFGPPKMTAVPLKNISSELRERFTMGGRALFEDCYGDATYPENYPLIYTDEEIDYYLEMISNGEYYNYGTLDYLLWDSLKKYPVRGLTVANMGSLTPWYEAILIYFGAMPTTIEYNAIMVKTERMVARTVREQEMEPLQFDAALSISSFEHDGLGAYGDPVDPDGDLKAMDGMRRIVRTGGLLYLNVPVGRDKVMFNQARVYGEVRLPKLLEGWEVVERFGFRESDLAGNGSANPLFVLRNR